MIQLQKLAKRVLELRHRSRELQCEGVICLRLPDQRRPLATALVSLSHCVYNGEDTVLCLVNTGRAYFHNHSDQFEHKILYFYYILLRKTDKAHPPFTFRVLLLKRFRSNTPAAREADTESQSAQLMVWHSDRCTTVDPVGCASATAGG